MKTKLLVTVASLLSMSAFAANWEIDSAHSSASFSVRHMMVSNVRGEFGKLTGMASYDPAHPTAATVEATIDASTINTREPKRDAHLKSADFFDVANHPTITFKSKKVTAADKGHLKITGDLNMRGITKEVTLAVDGPTAAMKDMMGGQRMGATATTKINRKDFGLNWNKALEAGGVLVGDEVTITLDVEWVQKSEAPKHAAK